MPRKPAWLARCDPAHGQLSPDDGRFRADARIAVGEIQICGRMEASPPLWLRRRARRSASRAAREAPSRQPPIRTLARAVIMPRPLSAIAPDWWDYTTLDTSLIEEAARLTPRDLARLARPGFSVILYDTAEDFYVAEALEYVNAWRSSTDDNPVGICGPIGPTEHLPLVARIVNALELDVRPAHFWGMD